MNILKIYQKYQIIPILANHQLRVAGVGSQLADYFPDLNKKDIITCCLLHDMGNILKINFDAPLSQETLTLAERSSGKKIKNEFQKKYGPDEHVATLKIVKELEVNRSVQDIIEAICFTKITDDQFLEHPLEHLICEYADMRVDPYGITTLDKRLEDLEKRYKGRFPTKKHQENRKKFARVMREVEKKIFADIDFEPEMITNQSLNDTIENLKSFNI